MSDPSTTLTSSVHTPLPVPYGSKEGREKERRRLGGGFASVFNHAANSHRCKNGFDRVGRLNQSCANELLLRLTFILT